jgi:hypothetical protein
VQRQDHMATVKTLGWVSLLGRRWKVSNTLDGYVIAARPHEEDDGICNLYFAHHRSPRVKPGGEGTG